MYAATELAQTLNALRQDTPYTPFSTSFTYEDLPEQQRVIPAQIQFLEPNIFGHLVGQMIAKPSNPVHVPDLPLLKRMLDPEHQFLIFEGNYPGRDECHAGTKKTMDNCSVGLHQVLRKHDLCLDDQSHTLGDAYGASDVYGDVQMQGDTRGEVMQVPHSQLIADVFGAEGDVAGLLQFFAQMQLDHIQCIRQVAASLQNTSLDNKTMGWGATGKSARGKNRPFEALSLCRDKVILYTRHIIHPPAILQPKRAANLRPESTLAMAKIFVTLHNKILSAPMKGGFTLLDDKVSRALVEKSALFDFGEMARMGSCINKQGVLVLDFVFNTGLKNA